jgi:hypothetical protein
VAYALRATPQPAGWPPATDRAEVERAAERAAQRVAAKLLAGPMAELRGAAARGESVDALAVALARLFPADDAAQAAAVVAPPPDALPGLRADLRPPHAARGAA